MVQSQRGDGEDPPDFDMDIQLNQKFFFCRLTHVCGLCIQEVPFAFSVFQDEMVSASILGAHFCNKFLLPYS